MVSQIVMVQGNESTLSSGTISVAERRLWNAYQFNWRNHFNAEEPDSKDGTHKFNLTHSQNITSKPYFELKNFFQQHFNYN